jgi:hydrogenase maturation protease
MNGPRPLRVVGVGSPLGDDALAWEVIHKLREWPGLSPDIEMYLVEGGQRLLDVLDGCGTLLLVDAMSAGTRPGTIHRFEWPDGRVEALRPGSTHDLRPAEALRLAAALGIAPPHTVVFAMEVESLDPQPRLSYPVTAAVPTLLRQLVEELEDRPTVPAALPLRESGDMPRG